MRRLGDVIPVPVSVRPDEAVTFTVTADTTITAGPGATAVAGHLARHLRDATGHRVPIETAEDGTSDRLEPSGNGPGAAFETGAPDRAVKAENAVPPRSGTEGVEPVEIDSPESGGSPEMGAPGNAVPSGNGSLIRLELTEGGDKKPESYELTIADGLITLRAPAPHGLFNGVQTLRQLLPVRGAAALPAAVLPAVVLPGGRIEDEPRFAYRGTMLDLARHFFAPADVKAYVDAVAAFKINHLHLHLTDDQGWRLEIPGWPRLTEIGGGPGTGIDGAGPGFLTADEYEDVVRYAEGRFITIVPEIDMPGHVNAAQVAYPELTRDGQAPPVRTDAEVGYSSLWAEGERTYEFVEDVIREVARLTPGPFLHIGGDEAFATPPEDYRTFLARVLPLAGKYGKRAVGWHEMAAVELPPTAVPQYWRIEPDNDGVARAAAAGHQVIMSPADRSYLDMKYDETTALGLDWAGLVSVERSYDWDPADRLPGVGEESVLGVEAPLWSETLRTLGDVQYMTFPRLPAIAEIGWSPRAARDWQSFRRRLALFGPRWEAEGTAFHRSPEVDWES